ncbi:TIGR04452 family lipoprotein [Leptospira langatensis]|uniref:TIGR04452 family lipoprotein n=1 Tax=Leptospira langatensis TaxID=2484983 RepID=A0A5F1ZWI5_9LEPT|nr:TIGR04452 family lipoprotein [Leptospira langatensis]TGK00142.1 TIGR04452 family lipoprotein [Leptospira langatensis]TGL42777.1 TIGR04452 family lipoprotein [Leptospira langatensis]
MKKTVLVLFGMILAKCMVAGPIGLATQFDYQRGDVVKQRLLTASIESDLLFTSLNGKPLAIDPTDILATEFKGLQEDKYYKKAQVDNCVKNILLLFNAVSPWDLNLRRNGPCALEPEKY